MSMKRKLEVEVSNEAFCRLAAIAYETGIAAPEEIAAAWLEDPAIAAEQSSDLDRTFHDATNRRIAGRLA